jgi:hypothetical protein
MGGEKKERIKYSIKNIIFYKKKEIKYYLNKIEKMRRICLEMVYFTLEFRVF